MTDTIEVPRELLERVSRNYTGRRNWDALEPDRLDAADELRALLAQPAGVPDEVRSLRNLCAELYQVLGVLDAPANALDAASAAANGEPVPAGSLLPFSGDQYEELRRDAKRYAHLKAAWDDDVLISYLDCNVHPDNWDATIDADMATKEVKE